MDATITLEEVLAEQERASSGVRVALCLECAERPRWGRKRRCYRCYGLAHPERRVRKLEQQRADSARRWREGKAWGQQPEHWSKLWDSKFNYATRQAAEKNGDYRLLEYLERKKQ